MENRFINVMASIVKDHIEKDEQKRREEADYETYSGFVLEKWFRQAYGETGEYNLVTNYWRKGSKGAHGNADKNQTSIIFV